MKNALWMLSVVLTVVSGCGTSAERFSVDDLEGTWIEVLHPVELRVNKEHPKGYVEAFQSREPAVLTFKDNWLAMVLPNETIRIEFSPAQKFSTDDGHPKIQLMIKDKKFGDHVQCRMVGEILEFGLCKVTGGNEGPMGRTTTYVCRVRTFKREGTEN